MALAALPDANLALISVPGEYAKEVAMKFLERGIHVHVFSDHVPKEDEVEMKKYAFERGLLVLGPGAGTSIINGVAIAFANAVRRGPVGIVASAGTGLQEVSSLIHNLGSGVSQGLGVGGGDVKNYVGGLMMKLGLKLLDQDEETKVLTIVAKPPEKETLESILQYVEKETRKPIVFGFMGKFTLSLPKGLVGRASAARSLHATALEAVRLVDEELYERGKEKLTIPYEKLLSMLQPYWEELSPKQKYIRGLFTGGTLTSEALTLLDELKIELYSNAPLPGQKQLPDPFRSVENTIVDLGEEEFTAGRAHPMIDPTIRRLRLIEEAKDPEVAVVLMDFVLGYGSHIDPVGAHLPAIKEAQKIAEADGRKLVIIGYVLGVSGDPQGYESQIEKLRSVGAIVPPTNAVGVLSAAVVASRGQISRDIVDKFYKEYFEAYIKAR
jgi:succinyl-CoA synthetase alpha subunit